jgi:hypothetical protein
MSNLSKSTAIFLSFILFCTSIITENHCFVPNSRIISPGQESLSSHSPIEKTSFILLNRHGEELVNSVRNLPVFNLRNQIFDIYCNVLSSQLRKLRISSEYLQFSGTISRNLTTGDIIFPFQYFW